MRILPFAPEHEAALLQLERESPQGKRIKLEMVRDRLLDRSRVFDDFQLYLVVSDENVLAGMMAAAITEIEHDGDRMPAGFCYDLRVKPEFRRQGYSKKMGAHVVEHFFRPRGIGRYFFTMKKTNLAVLKATQSVLGLAYAYPFRYLTIPASTIVRHRGSGLKSMPHFGVTVSRPDDLPEGWYHAVDDATGLFDTYRMYQIKVSRIGALMKCGMSLVEWLRGQSGAFPRENEVMRFAALCHSRVPSVDTMNRLLRGLKKDDVRFLIVACQKKDPVDRLLGRAAINALDYLLVSNFRLQPDDHFRIDVRCL